MKRLFFFLMGIIWGAFGLLVIIDPTFYDPDLGFFFDFTGYNVPFGIFIVVVGIIFIVVGLRRKASDFEEVFLICPKCEKSYRKSEVPEMQCPSCKTGLEKLKGYYNHKEEKEKERSCGHGPP